MPITLNTSKLNVRNTSGNYIPITAIIEEGTPGEGGEIQYDMSQINEAVSAAQTSASNAAASATSASSAASRASNSASNAATSATNAATSEQNAATYAQNAQNAVDGIATDLLENDSFKDSIMDAVTTDLLDNDSFNSDLDTKISNSIGEMMGLSDNQIPWVANGYIVNLTAYMENKTQGDFSSTSYYKCSDYIEIKEGADAIIFETDVVDNDAYNAFYSDKPASGASYNESYFIQNFSIKGTVPIPTGAKYFRLSLVQSRKVNFRYDYYVSSYLGTDEILYHQSYGGIPDSSKGTTAYNSGLWKLLYTYEGEITKGAFNLGDIYTIKVDYIKNNPDTSPFGMTLHYNDSNKKQIYTDTVTITAEDITKGINKIEFWLYPIKAKSGSNYNHLFNNGFIFKELTIVRGRSTGITAEGDLRRAIVDTINNPYSLPDYYFTVYSTSNPGTVEEEKHNYLPKKVNKINELGKEASDMFIFITDVHWESNRKLSPAIINYLDHNCHIPRLFCGGDIGDGGNEDFVNELRKAFSHNIYHVIGNHERINTTGKSLYYSMDSYNNDQIGDPDGHYYYVDNIQQKIRYIVLNAFNAEKVYDYNNTQYNWFAEVLDSTQRDWDIIIFTHDFGMSEITTNNDQETITFTPATSELTKYVTKMHQFNNKTYQAGDSENITAKKCFGKILAIFQGHQHVDAIYHTGTYQVGTITSDGIPIIVTTCDKCGRSATYEDYLTQTRTVGDVSEQAFDVVAIKREINNNKRDVTITCERVGAKAMNNMDIPYIWNDSNPQFNFFYDTLETREIVQEFDYDS